MFSIASAIAAVFGFLRDLLGLKRREEDRQAGRDEVTSKVNAKQSKPKKRWMALLVLPMTLFLTACDLENSNVVVQIVCPRINEYDVKTQDRALAEYNALPRDSALRLFIGDYKQLRDQVRVCRGEKLPSYTEPAKIVQPKPVGLSFKDRWYEGVKVAATAFR